MTGRGFLSSPVSQVGAMVCVFCVNGGEYVTDYDSCCARKRNSGQGPSVHLSRNIFLKVANRHSLDPSTTEARHHQPIFTTSIIYGSIKQTPPFPHHSTAVVLGVICITSQDRTSSGLSGYNNNNETTTIFRAIIKKE